MEAVGRHDTRPGRGCRIRPISEPGHSSGVWAASSSLLLPVARGRSNSQIATERFLEESTVKTDVSSVLTKLGVSGRVQAVILAYEGGLVSAGTLPADEHT
jgi:hypothetical protein